MDKWSLLNLILGTNFRLSRWMRIEKWKGLRNAHIREKRHFSAKTKWPVYRWEPTDRYGQRKVRWDIFRRYKSTQRGPFWPFCNANLYHISLITGRLAENKWLTLPWDVWNLILQHLPYAKESMAPVCIYFRDKIASRGEPECMDPYPVDCMHWRCTNFEDYEPRISKKRAYWNNGVSHSSGVSDNNISGISRQAIVVKWCPRWGWWFKDFVVRIWWIDLTLLYLLDSHTGPRIRKPLVAGKYFQEFEWKPD